MNAPSVDIKDMLSSSESATGLIFGTDLFVGQMPESPNECTCVYDTGGFDTIPTNEIIERPTIMIHVRGDKQEYRDGYALAKSIKDFLNGIYNEIWNSTRYIGIWIVGDINHIGYDENSRPLFSINFRIDRTST